MRSPFACDQGRWAGAAAGRHARITSKSSSSSSISSVDDSNDVDRTLLQLEFYEAQDNLGPAAAAAGQNANCSRKNSWLPAESERRRGRAVSASSDVPGESMYCAHHRTNGHVIAGGVGSQLHEENGSGINIQKLLKLTRPCSNDRCGTQSKAWRVLNGPAHLDLRQNDNVDELNMGLLAARGTSSAAHGRDQRVCCLPNLLGCCSRLFKQQLQYGNVVQIVTADGPWVFTAHQDHKIRVWKKQTCTAAGYNTAGSSQYRLLSTLPTRLDYIRNCFGQQNYVQLRRHHHCLSIQHADAISVLAFSPGRTPSSATRSVCKNDFDEPLLYSASWDKTFKVWRLSDFKCIESVTAHDDAINAMALMQGSCCDGSTTYDQHLVFTGSSDGTVKAWAKKAIYNGGHKIMRGSLKLKHKLAATLAPPTKCAVNALAISDDGAVLFSAGSDGLIRVWRRLMQASTQLQKKQQQQQAVNMMLCGVVEGHKRAVLCLSVVGDLLLSGSADNTLRVWSVRHILALRHHKGKESDNKKQFASACCMAVMEGHKAPVKNIWAMSCPHAAGCAHYTVYTGGLNDEAIKVWSLHDLSTLESCCERINDKSCPPASFN
ncbi:hypothetical protein L7F22_017960 [Adiantum nelumboides]|nr:hypothetical protein [Adiantum nelumboides]